MIKTSVFYVHSEKKKKRDGALRASTRSSDNFVNSALPGRNLSQPRDRFREECVLQVVVHWMRDF